MSKRKIKMKLIALWIERGFRHMFSDKDLLEDICYLLLCVVMAILKTGIFPAGTPILLLQEPLKALIDKIDGKEDL